MPSILPLPQRLYPNGNEYFSASGIEVLNNGALFNFRPDTLPSLSLSPENRAVLQFQTFNLSLNCIPLYNR